MESGGIPAAGKGRTSALFWGKEKIPARGRRWGVVLGQGMKFGAWGAVLPRGSPVRYPAISKKSGMRTAGAPWGKARTQRNQWGCQFWATKFSEAGSITAIEPISLSSTHVIIPTRGDMEVIAEISPPLATAFFSHRLQPFAGKAGNKGGP
jgi:hypothetical protein